MEKKKENSSQEKKKEEKLYCLYTQNQDCLNMLLLCVRLQCYFCGTDYLLEHFFLSRSVVRG